MGYPDPDVYRLMDYLFQGQPRGPNGGPAPGRGARSQNYQMSAKNQPAARY